jgi:hypothetical protein
MLYVFDRNQFADGKGPANNNKTISEYDIAMIRRMYSCDSNVASSRFGIIEVRIYAPNFGGKGIPCNSEVRILNPITPLYNL